MKIKLINLRREVLPVVVADSPPPPPPWPLDTIPNTLDNTNFLYRVAEQLSIVAGEPSVEVREKIKIGITIIRLRCDIFKKVSESITKIAGEHAVQRQKHINTIIGLKDAASIAKDDKMYELGMRIAILLEFNTRFPLSEQWHLWMEAFLMKAVKGFMDRDDLNTVVSNCSNCSRSCRP